MQKAVLLVNLGSPHQPTKRAVGRYLREFLMDPHVMDLPYLLRFFLVNIMIVPRRRVASATLYKKIWTEAGSPLIVNTERLAARLQARLPWPVYIGMRYGQPSIKSAMQKMQQQGVRKLYVVPLYPQYAMSTTLTVNREVAKQAKRWLPAAELITAPAFYQDRGYQQTLAASIKRQLAGVEFDHLLFSYHGIPERHLIKTDPTGSHCLSASDCCHQPPAEVAAVCYRHQCMATTRLAAERLQLPPEKYSIAYQSRLGKDPWLQPYTSDAIAQLAAKGVKRLAVVTPAFVSDCLETIEEIGMEAREEFLKAGGMEFTRLDCLNDDEAWADVLADWSKKALAT